MTHSAEIEELKSALKKAEKWNVSESKEIKRFGALVELLRKKQGLTEMEVCDTLPKFRRTLIREEEKTSLLEKRLDELIKIVLDNIDSLDKIIRVDILAKAKAEMGEFEYIGGKFVKRGSESHEKATKADDVREIEKLRKKVGESNEEKERRELLEEINISGRLGATTSVGSEFGKKRGVSSGFQNFIDGKSKDESLNSALRDSVNSEYGSFNVGMKYPFSRESAFGAHNIRYLLEENNINAAVTITPVIIKRPVYEKKTVEIYERWEKTRDKYYASLLLGKGIVPKRIKIDKN